MAKKDPFHHFNPLQFFLLFLVISITHNWQHEFFHLAACLFFGGEGAVRIVMPFFITDINTQLLTTTQNLIVVYAGGLGVGLLCWFEWWTAHRDPEARIVFHAIGWSQAIYGVVEGTAYMLGAYQHIQTLGIAAMLIGTIYALARSKIMWNPPTQ